MWRWVPARKPCIHIQDREVGCLCTDNTQQAVNSVLRHTLCQQPICQDVQVPRVPRGSSGLVPL